MIYNTEKQFRIIAHAFLTQLKTKFATISLLSTRQLSLRTKNKFVRVSSDSRTPQWKSVRPSTLSQPLTSPPKSLSSRRRTRSIRRRERRRMRRRSELIDEHAFVFKRWL